MYVSSLLLSSENKALLMVYSMRLGLTLVSSLNDLWLVGGWRYSPFFPRVCLLWSVLPFFIFDMFIVVCASVCVCSGLVVVLGFTNSFFLLSLSLSLSLCECVDFIQFGGGGF